MSAEFAHKPILADEVIAALQIVPGAVCLDGTLGGGGHTERMLAQGAVVYGIDRDADAISHCRQRFADDDKFHPILGNYTEAAGLLGEKGVEGIDGALLDLGVSSYQLDEPARGFSYMKDGPLDMRMGQDGIKAAEIVNNYSERKLFEILRDYGEEKFAWRIAQAIVKRRTEKRFETTLELAEAIKNAMPAFARREAQHPAKRSFQAIRIEANDELRPLQGALESIAGLLHSGKRLCVITFHSLEDRIVKNTFKSMENPCTCPPKSPYCICGRKPTATVVTRKPIYPGDGEVEENPRARSAKLRIIEKL
ncbi:MAG: 16S rRNA (cytosine(1402)-N(4))-methyltransferase RsmH [Christensenellales bacterium]